MAREGCLCATACYACLLMKAGAEALVAATTERGPLKPWVGLHRRTQVGLLARGDVRAMEGAEGLLGGGACCLLQGVERSRHL